ncbi:hypothetical protein BDC45DRAFT_542062 [Circinella umbellata]|nr:hypothetical protein BDC45DRAFT_542062 [Circinella umbellata]
MFQTEEPREKNYSSINCWYLRTALWCLLEAQYIVVCTHTCFTGVRKLLKVAGRVKASNVKKVRKDTKGMIYFFIPFPLLVTVARIARLDPNTSHPVEKQTSTRGIRVIREDPGTQRDEDYYTGFSITSLSEEIHHYNNFFLIVQGSLYDLMNLNILHHKNCPPEFGFPNHLRREGRNLSNLRWMKYNWMGYKSRTHQSSPFLHFAFLN